MGTKHPANRQVPSYELSFRVRFRSGLRGLRDRRAGCMKPVLTRSFKARLHDQPLPRPKQRARNHEGKSCWSSAQKGDTGGTPPLEESALFAGAAPTPAPALQTVSGRPGVSATARHKAIRRQCWAKQLVPRIKKQAISLKYIHKNLSVLLKHEMQLSPQLCSLTGQGRARNTECTSADTNDSKVGQDHLQRAPKGMSQVST